jgi:hypothetical protein
MEYMYVSFYYGAAYDGMRMGCWIAESGEREEQNRK